MMKLESGLKVVRENFRYSKSRDTDNLRKPTFRLQKFLIAIFILPILFYVTWLIPTGRPLSVEHVFSKPKRIKKSVPVSALNVFQVYSPVIIPSISTGPENFRTVSTNVELIDEDDISTSCQVILMKHSFGLSYGKPFVGNYTPPQCSFNRVVMNFRATSQGRQFDRLAVMYLNDTEVWRTSTAEPTKSGIVFEYTKDMSTYISLWKTPQTLIFDLGNLIDETYTAPFNTTLTATFFMDHEVSKPADQIIPISARKSKLNAPSAFTLPTDVAINILTLPQNANRAVFSLSACGQATEEFWWANVLQSDSTTFNATIGTLFGYSPFREVQLLVDGQIAGVYWPFTTIFTGGVAPGFWRPIVGIDTYDLREHEIDLTPWLGILSDGKSHTFEIRVVGIQDDHEESGTLTEKVGESWLVTGKIFLWLDSDYMARTTGTWPEIRNPSPSISISRALTQNPMGRNETLAYSADVKRTLSISSTITTSLGTRQASWTQSLITTNHGLFEAQGNIQVTNQTTIGTDESIGNVNFKSTYSYPLWVRTVLETSDKNHYDLDAELTRGLAITTEGTSLFPTGLESFLYNSQRLALNGPGLHSFLETTQNGTGHYSSAKSAKTSVSYGKTMQELSLSAYIDKSAKKELYYRNVAATNGSIIQDHERITGREIPKSITNNMPAGDVMIFASRPDQNILQKLALKFL